MVSSTPNPIRLQTHSKVAVKAAKVVSPTARVARALVVRMRQSNNGVLQGVPSQAPRSDLGSHGGRKAIARCPCTPQGPMEARGEKINVSSGPSKEIAGLKKKMMMKMMTPGSQDSRVWEFSHEALKVRGALLAYV